MFTGIVEGIARVSRLEITRDGGRLELADVPFGSALVLGESVAINGCCLTVVDAGEATVSFDLLQQTLHLTNLGNLMAGQEVNFERAMQVGGRFSGHMVQGHIDGTGLISGYKKIGHDHRLDLEIPHEMMACVIAQGSIAVNGMSLTVAECRAEGITIWITPHTHASTTLVWAEVGSRVNIETDMIAKYVAQIIRLRSAS